MIQYLTAYPWQAWLTGTGEPDADFDHLDKLVGRWRSHLAHLSGLQVAAVGVFTTDPQPHVHVLLLGRNKHGQTLADIDTHLRLEMARTWEKMSFRSGKFDLLYNRDGSVGYTVCQNTILKPAEFLRPRGIKLLKRIKTSTI